MNDAKPRDRVLKRVRAAITGKHRFWVAFALGAAVVVSVELLVRYTPIADKIAVPLLLPDSSDPADVMVLLGAGVDDFCTPNLPAVRRTILAARLFRLGKAPRLLVTGGTSRRGGSCTVARVMADFAEELGVPKESIVLEEHAENTWQNARYSEPLLRAIGARRILLVTDALHMRRAEACFRARGFETTRAAVPAIQLYGNNIDLLRVALHEYLGLVYYRLKGYTSGAPS
jgi:uncharacterized SAM-binding protein YcdF (DUF218 family)